MAMDEFFNADFNGAKYEGSVLVENNVGRALINELLRYEWSRQRLLAAKKPDQEHGE